MIRHQFYVPENKLDGCKTIIRSIPSARFLRNPIFVNNKWLLEISFDTMKDSTKMGELLTEYLKEEEKTNIFDNIIYKLKKTLKKWKNYTDQKKTQ